MLIITNIYYSDISVNGMNITWEHDTPLQSNDVLLTPGVNNDTILVDLLRRDISFIVTRTNAKKFGFYLGFFAVNVADLSDHCDGVLGMLRSPHTP